MPDASFNQPSFLGGEWSPEYQGRLDNPRYKTAMNVCLNGMPLEEGAWTRRTGTKFVAPTAFGLPARLFSFAYNETLPFTLEFADGRLRIFNGDDLVLEPPVNVVSISAASPAVLQVASAQSWNSGDMIEILVTTPGAPPALAGLINRQMKVTKIDTTHFSLTDTTDSSDVDGTVDGNVWDGTTTAQAARVVFFDTPYTNSSWYDNRVVQFRQNAIIFNPGFTPHYVAITSANASAGRFSTFTFGSVTFEDGPYYAPVANQTVTSSGLSGTVMLTFTNGFGPAVGGGTVSATSADVGRLVRLFSEPPAWVVGTPYAAGDRVSYGGTYWTAIAANTSSGPAPDTDFKNWVVNPTAAFWIWGIIQTVPSGTTATVALQGSLLYATTINTWRLGLFGGALGFPSCGCVHEGRVWMGFQNFINGSQPGDAFFKPSTINMIPTLQDGTVTDASGISYALEAGSEDANKIQWLNPDQSGITAGTFAGEWLLQASTLSDPLTATSIQAKRVTKYGSGNVDPVRPGLALVFVQKFRHRLMEMIADVFTGRYRAPDLALTSRHLTENQIEELAYQEELTPVIWMRMRDGSWKGCTYRRVSTYGAEDPTFVGWHQHSLGSARGLISLTMGAIPRVAGT